MLSLTLFIFTYKSYQHFVCACNFRVGSVSNYYLINIYLKCKNNHTVLYLKLLLTQIHFIMASISNIENYFL